MASQFSRTLSETNSSAFCRNKVSKFWRGERENSLCCPNLEVSTCFSSLLQVESTTSTAPSSPPSIFLPPQSSFDWLSASWPIWPSLLLVALLLVPSQFWSLSLPSWVLESPVFLKAFSGLGSLSMNCLLADCCWKYARYSHLHDFFLSSLSEQTWALKTNQLTCSRFYSLLWLPLDCSLVKNFLRDWVNHPSLTSNVPRKREGRGWLL